jgi:hypothetical protein
VKDLLLLHVLLPITLSCLLKVDVYEVPRHRRHVLVPCLATLLFSQTAIDCLLPIRLSLLPEDSTLPGVVVIVVRADDVVNAVSVVAVKSF